LYLKNHSYGEYVFDWSWAEAYQNHGLDYYPKLLAAIPFTPATGQRLVKAADCSDEVTAVVAKALQDKAQQLGASGWHVLFLEKEELAQWVSTSADMRLGCQFHWHNEGYSDFDGFLAAMNSKKRRTLRKERNSLTAQGIEFKRLTGDAITPVIWQRFQAFYQLTNLKYNRHHGYLTPDFFERIYLTMRDSLLLVVAFEGEEAIAGALNFIGRDTLYGRYWGCIREVEFLHFETCYYQGIDYCIEQGIQRFDSGAQGEHKVARGFRPTLTYSVHYLAHSGFKDAVKRFLVEESAAIQHYCDEMTKALPFRQVEGD
jgi:predicted N-acyltransferase